MVDEKHLLDTIKTDQHNLQQMLNLLNDCDSKGRWRSISASIKTLVKEIHNTKVLLDDKVWDSKKKISFPLFECEPTPLDGLEAFEREFEGMNSFFGELGD